jgi:hypothetical protein
MVREQIAEQLRDGQISEKGDARNFQLFSTLSNIRKEIPSIAILVIPNHPCFSKIFPQSKNRLGAQWHKSCTSARAVRSEFSDRLSTRRLLVQVTRTQSVL